MNKKRTLVGYEGYCDVTWRGDAEATEVGHSRLGASRHGTGHRGRNLRHKRKGHLFQNRYKSIVVEEEPYFLELVR